jgi:hypothetical protein
MDDEARLSAAETSERELSAHGQSEVYRDFFKAIATVSILNDRAQFGNL